MRKRTLIIGIAVLAVVAFGLWRALRQEEMPPPVDAIGQMNAIIASQLTGSKAPKDAYTKLGEMLREYEQSENLPDGFLFDACQSLRFNAWDAHDRSAEVLAIDGLAGVREFMDEIAQYDSVEMQLGTEYLSLAVSDRPGIDELYFGPDPLIDFFAARRMGMIAVAAARIAAERGDEQSALEYLETALASARHLTQASTLIARLAAASVAEMVADEIRCLVLDGRLHAAEAIRFLEGPVRQHSIRIADAAAVVQSERLYVLDMFWRARFQSSDEQSIADVIESLLALIGATEERDDDRFDRWMRSCNYRSALAGHNAYFDELEFEVAGQALRSESGVIQEFDGLKREYFDALDGTLCHAFQSISLVTSVAATNLLATRLIEHRERTGLWPRSVEGFEDSLEPISGEAFRYTFESGTDRPTLRLPEQTIPTEIWGRDPSYLERDFLAKRPDKPSAPW